MLPLFADATYTRKGSKVLDEHFLHGRDRRPEAVDAKFFSIIFEHVEELFEAGTALARQQVVEFRTYARFFADVRHEVADDARYVFLLTAAVLHQSKVIANPFTNTLNLLAIFTGKNTGVNIRPLPISRLFFLTM